MLCFNLVVSLRQFHYRNKFKQSTYTTNVYFGVYMILLCSEIHRLFIKSEGKDQRKLWNNKKEYVNIVLQVFTICLLYTSDAADE